MQFFSKNLLGIIFLHKSSCCKNTYVLRKRKSRKNLFENCKLPIWFLKNTILLAATVFLLSQENFFTCGKEIIHLLRQKDNRRLYSYIV